MLAAGASSRMGQPKALLTLPSGERLAERQSRVLREAGCARAVVVLGAEAERIAAELRGVEIVVHSDWARGRFSSLQAGLRAGRGADGFLILPVDIAGIRAATLGALLAAAESSGAPALRPRHVGVPGRVLWIRADLAQELLAEPARDIRVDERLAAVEAYVDCDDPAIHRNINTPNEWTTFISEITGQN